MNEQETIFPQQIPFDQYEIRVKVHLDDRWLGRLGCQTATYEKDGTTCLVVQVVDQAALYGLLRKLRDLGLPLLSINRVDLKTA